MTRLWTTVATCALIAAGLGSMSAEAQTATAEASAVRHPAPETFDAAPPRIAVGDAIDPAAVTTLVQEVGYAIDDRVDEPGEGEKVSTSCDVNPSITFATTRLIQ